MSWYFTKIFVHLSVNAAVCSFSFYKLLGWDPAKLCSFKVNSINTRKKSGICPKLTIKGVESRYYSVFISNFEEIVPFFRVFIVDFA